MFGGARHAHEETIAGRRLFGRSASLHGVKKNRARRRRRRLGWHEQACRESVGNGRRTQRLGASEARLNACGKLEKNGTGAMLRSKHNRWLRSFRGRAWRERNNRR